VFNICTFRKVQILPKELKIFWQTIFLEIPACFLIDRNRPKSISVEVLRNSACVRGKFSCFKDDSSCFKDDSSCFKDESSCFKDESSCFKDESSCFKDDSSCFKDESSCFKDESSCFKDESSCFKDESSCVKEKSSCVKGNCRKLPRRCSKQKPQTVVREFIYHIPPYPAAPCFCFGGISRCRSGNLSVEFLFFNLNPLRDLK
jgi:hypothetical protein